MRAAQVEDRADMVGLDRGREVAPAELRRAVKPPVRDRVKIAAPNKSRQSKR
jgi:hypothetical protein